MTIDLAKLRALAAAATPGPWGYLGIDIVQLTDGGKGYPLDYYPDSRDVIDGKCAECGTYNRITEPDAAFIAAAHPQAVLELIDEVERLSEELHGWRKNRLHGGCEEDRLAEVARTRQAEDERDAARAELAQRDKDWTALMVEIAKTAGDRDDREFAELGEVEEFDPWHALRTLDDAAARGTK